MNPALVPGLEPLALPGPVWLFETLLLVTFVLHLLFVNLTLGGTLLAAVSQLLSKARRDDPRTALARRLMAVNTFAISMTITTGVAPLLFVQVLYHQYFYTATILLGWIWFGVVLLLLVGYSSAYVFKLRGLPAGGEAAGTMGGTIWLVLSAAIFLAIAMVQVAVNLIHSQPETWGGVAANPWSVLADPAYFPRLLHFLLAAIAFSALVMCWWAVRRAAAGDDVGRNHAIAEYTWKWAMWTTLAQLIEGFVLLVVLPRPVLIAMMTGGASTLLPLGLSIFLALGLVAMLARPIDPSGKKALVSGSLATMVLIIAIMSITRTQVRQLSLDPVTSTFERTVAAQWSNFALFAILLIAGLGTVAYMVRLGLSGPNREA